MEIILDAKLSVIVFDVGLIYNVRCTVNKKVQSSSKSATRNYFLLVNSIFFYDISLQVLLTNCKQFEGSFVEINIGASTDTKSDVL